MSATAARPPVARVPAEGTPVPAADRGPVAIRLLVFAALATFAAAHWTALVQSPPVGRLLLCVGLVTAAGALLNAIGGARLPRPAVHAIALVTVLAAAALALATMGLPIRLLGPRNWDELASELGRGMSGIRTVVWPYAGPEAAVRLVILLGAPVLLALAAALTFWPARRGAGVLRVLGLVTLLCLYGIPVTDHDPGAPLARGLVLFALVAAWLWLPRLRGRQALPGAALVAAMALVALPLSARLDRADALVDYSQWNWFGGKEVSFDWNHSYGPLNWPRKGTTLLQVKSNRPLYWKAEVLDTFDGLRWNRSDANDRTSPLAELPAPRNPRWNRRIGVTVRSLRTDFVIGTGTPTRVAGAGQAVTGASDGTLKRLDEPLRRGDRYTVEAYAPTPTAGRMRAAPKRYDPALASYTSIDLPRADASALKSLPSRPDRGRQTRVTVPLAGNGVGDPDAGRRLAESPYGRAYRLSRRLAGDAPSTYAAVTAVRDYLQSGFTYSERPPSRRYPLESFLFQDKIGYCQQFSGAMALLLRMQGIPTRVATGFSPGSYNKDTGEYRVRDLDAHSWVEVYFSGIGWVTFDPTPAAAPADRAGQEPDVVRAGGSDSGPALSSSAKAPSPERVADTPSGKGTAGGASGGGGPPAVVLVGAAIVAALGGAGVWVARRRRRPVSSEDGIRELERALRRLGWRMPGGTTLLELEDRLERAAGPASARYVRELRARRFTTGALPGPSSADRRALRKELTSSGGPLARLRGFMALPPRRHTA
ncbi:MAG: transglutaminaseTgpA domain-containing protein [Thermoleophilaceae bacterium]